MSLLTDLLTVTCESDTYESILSCMFYKKSISWILQTLEELLQKVRKIDHPIKRSKLSTNYFNLKRYLEDMYEEEQLLSSIFFVNEKVYEYKLNHNECSVIEEYKIRDYHLYNDSTFRNAYFHDLFYNFDFHYSFIVNKSECMIKKWNEHKEKIVESMGKFDKEFYEKIRKVYHCKSMIYIYGNHTKGNKEICTLSNPKLILLERDDYGRNELNIIAKREEMRENHAILQERLQDLQNEKKIDLYLFGKLKFEIKDAIEAYSLKELFIQKEKYEKLRSWIDHDAFNFKVYFIDRLEAGDVGDQFIQNYNGVMGVKYF